MLTVLAGEAEGVRFATGGDVTDSSGEIEGDSSGIVGGVGAGDCCAAATDAKMAIRNAKLTLVVMD